MQWRRTEDYSLVLHIREGLGQPWKHYKDTPYFVADYKIQNGSKGFATMQSCLKQGFQFVTTDGEVPV